MNKKNKIIISLVAVIAIYGVYKVAFANGTEQKLVEKVNSRIEKQDTDTDLDFSEEENETKIKTIAKKVLKKTQKDKSDELYIDDNDTEEDDCYRSVYIPDAKEICIDEDEENFFITSDGTTEGRKKAIAQKAIEIREEAFGGKTPFDNPEIGERVCKVVLAEQLFAKSHQGDIYQVYFCDDKEQVASRLDLRSGGIDSENIEYIMPATYLPYSPSITLSEDYKGPQTEEEWKKDSEFNAKKELPRDIKESEKVVLNEVGAGEVISSRLIVLPSDMYAHEVTLKSDDNQIKKYYVGSKKSNIVLNENEIKNFVRHHKEAQKVVDKLTSEQWNELVNSDKLSEYIAKYVHYSEKELKFGE